MSPSLWLTAHIRPSITSGRRSRLIVAAGACSDHRRERQPGKLALDGAIRSSSNQFETTSSLLSSHFTSSHIALVSRDDGT
jgi:hypothetical protein